MKHKEKLLPEYLQQGKRKLNRKEETQRKKLVKKYFEEKEQEKIESEIEEMWNKTTKQK